jgi:peptidoglycan hydrolase-like protein with peptidoglycan-binding domain
MAPHVERAQRALNERMQSGEPLVVDGAFGGKTEAAVKQWQTHRGLQVDGIIGPETWPTLLT